MKLEELKKLPHIYRKITAEVVLWVQGLKQIIKSLALEKKQKINKILPLLFLVGYILFIFFYPVTKFEKIKNSVSVNPNSAQNRALLTQAFLENGQYEDALKETDLGLALFPDSLTLQGQKQQTVELLNKPGQLKDELSYWNNVSGKFPDYRDALWKKAVLDFRLKDHLSAAKDLEMVLIRDPNFIPALKLRSILRERGYQVD